MTDLTPGSSVTYRPYGMPATYLGADDNRMARIRYYDATETVVHPDTLDVWPYPVILVPRAEVRRVHTDHGSPSFPQIDGDGVTEVGWVRRLASDYRELAEDSDQALHLTALADDLDELADRYDKVAA
ncbi:hypothetical protein Ade02nite_20990 [Paractinoplanes deccanensis]|uniref:Uncharacterized protein n=1 Tax=Paractinoplanes deccanensis TaxID=113561 RepID=A0ABQ3Y0E2_9ACTN|nr:hypothetical protein [Actinoplanes deccanensis]GID73458.1 hypothetical protein Ade02nite_20990 [Actinoplanes deccanensis]